MQIDTARLVSELMCLKFGERPSILPRDREGIHIHQVRNSPMDSLSMKGTSGFAGMGGRGQGWQP